jgi:hypothetical protein
VQLLWGSFESASIIAGNVMRDIHCFVQDTNDQHLSISLLEDDDMPTNCALL